MWSDKDLIPLRQKVEDDYLPEEEELMQYAKHIGLDDNDVLIQELLYLAYEGIQAKLPAGWQACKAPDESIVYRNKKTKVVIQEHPLDEVYRQKVIEKKKQLTEEGYSENSEDIKELSAISEEDNEMKNQSELYGRRKLSNLQAPLAPVNSLRQGITNIEFKNALDSQSIKNSALNHNIPSNQFTSGRLEVNSGKMLPSSLLREVPSAPLNPNMKQYLTQLTQRVPENKSENYESDRSSRRSDKIVNLETKRQQLQQLQKQKNMKLALLEQIRKSNNEKLQKLKRRMKSKQ